MIIASVLNSLTRKSKMNTGMRIGCTKGEILLHHAELAPDAIRRVLSPVFSGFEVAKHHGRPRSPQSDSVGQLERLAVLHREGALSDDEFTAAKRRLLDGKAEHNG
jgi:hypothetical protein